MNDETLGEASDTPDNRSGGSAHARAEKSPDPRASQRASSQWADRFLGDDQPDEPDRRARPPRRRKTVDVTSVPPQPLHRLLSTVGNAAGVRYEILFLLAAKRLDVGTLAIHLDLDQPLVSKHLAQLREAGLVIAVYEKAHRVYALAGNARLVKFGGGSASEAITTPAIELTGSDDFAAVLIDKRVLRKQTPTKLNVVVSQSPKLAAPPSVPAPPTASAGSSEQPVIEMPKPVVRPRARKKPQA